MNKPMGLRRRAMNKPKVAAEVTYVLQAVMAWQVSPVQNSEMVLYCRLIRLKNVVAARTRREESSPCVILDNPKNKLGKWT